ncbi:MULTISPECIES: hypothetical protein [unclassified Streptomyces]|uniref:Integral membrane protein n=1 Tax=Streptomyces niveiscabiei TaxID=164115 RepID=A0ABW9I2D8_9ACTN|nr:MULTISPECIES: hypothetical protein [unclassified Streptomyces]QZZ31858.1 hypothetical protein A7X85_41595 [Streptomyces sp. ST1015]
MYGSYRTNGLWAGVGLSLTALLVGCMVASVDMMEFDERCMHGLTTGPGKLLRTRDQAFPPATVCEFEHGDVSSIGGHGLLNVLLWAGLAVLVTCLLVALVAECLEPPLGGRFVEPMTRTAKLRRTGTAFFVLGSVFAGAYALFGWRLLAGPASACSRGADWGSNQPRTLEYTLFPPQFTCQYTSGLTRRMNPEWAASFTLELAALALLSGIGFALALRRLWRERRTAPGRSREPQAS